MVRPALRSRSKRRVYVRTPTGTKLTFRQRKPSQAKCGACGIQLLAVPRANKTGMRAIARSKRRPERPYGGVLCSVCMRKRMKSLAD
ncbi:MAG: 50S ribosomal protein L34e [archaeon]